MFRTTFFILILFLNALVFGQGITENNKYWIHLNDQHIQIQSQNKTNSLSDINNLLKKYNLQVENYSNWLNAVTVIANPSQLEELQQDFWMDSISPVTGGLYTAALEFDPEEYGDFIQCMKPEVLQEKGLNGKGVIVGIIDAGFVNADSSKLFAGFFESNRVLAYRDFIDPDREDFFEGVTDGDFHGRKVWGYLAGNDPEKKHLEGMATGASFLLARTENGEKEHLVEEDDWIAALEWMHENGVQLVNTSLGYSEFDDTTQNHVLSDMNGRTTMISRAADIATREKGMMLVISAGNMGNKEWHHITAPADVRGALTVGAVEKKHWKRASYSSVGVEFVDYIKPNVATYSNRGTSYSAPAVCGFVACLMQYKPELTNLELLEVIEKSSHLYPYGNNYVGYGVPQADRALAIIDGEYEAGSNTWQHLPDEKDKKVEIELNEDPKIDVVVFNKKDNQNTVDQIVIKYNRLKKKKKQKERLVKKGDKYYVRLYRRDAIKVSTVHAGNDVIEVIW